MKKLINSPAGVTSDMLASMALADRNLLYMPDLNILVRADFAHLRDSGRVALISGGGAGHEPAHGGYIGKGMLTAAVTGEVFTSPSVDAVLAAIRLVTGPAGCLLIVKNYTGDRLNFGLAAAIARSEGHAVEMVLVEDDVALASKPGRAGARGLAGAVLAHKFAGAHAEAGMALSDLKAGLEGFICGVRTMGVGLSACTIPAVGTPGFELGADEIEYGLGIHGEAGVSREQMATAREIASRLVGTIADQLTNTAGQRVALLVNGLGATPPSELAIVAGAAIEAARARGLVVERVHHGSLLTALEMAGCSITIAAVDDGALAALDADTSARAWPVGLRPADAVVPLGLPAAPASAEVVSGPALSSQRASYFVEAIECVARALIGAEAELTELDSRVGDGDLGISLARGARAVLDQIDALDTLHPAAAVHAISGILRRSLGGTSGPLYAVFTLAVATSLADADEAALPAWAQALNAGCAAITDLGGARRNDRTMLDALLPAAEALDAAAMRGATAPLALAQAVEAARAGAEATADLAPVLGRSSYVGERAKGHVDPGAAAVVIWLTALTGALSK